MTPTERLFDFSHALDDRVTVVTLLIIGSVLLFVPMLALLLRMSRLITSALSRELWVRTASWAVIVVLVVGPILLGAFWAILVIFALAVGGYIEYARITGLFRQRSVSWAVLIGITMVFFAVLDHWYGMFVAMIPLGVVAIAAIALIGDDPRGYVQRVALGILGYLLFAGCLGHLAYFGNSTYFRPLLLLVLTATALNDVFAYACGKLFGRRKLCPNTSPNKTVAGAVGALLLTTICVTLLGRPLLDHAPGLTIVHLAFGGMILSLCGQLGDLMLSSIKRDVGIKDTGVIIPGHGGLLDRLDSLLLTAPASFHFVGYFVGVGLDQQTRLISGA